jgi:hypothetical protein
MRIKGPGNGAPPVDGPESVDPTDEVKLVGETEATAASTEVSGPAAVGQTGAAGSVDAVGQVAAQLRAGEITVDQAVERLIDDAIRRQLGSGDWQLQNGDRARDLEPRLRELLRSYAESDPFLAARIRKLTLAK